MAVSVQIVGREASKQLSMKYSDLTTTSSLATIEDDVPEQKKLSLQSFLLSNYSNSPRRRLSVEDLCEKSTPNSALGPVFELEQRRHKEFFSTSKLKEDSNKISLTALGEDRVGPMLHLRNCIATPAELVKKSSPGLLRSKTYQEMSWKCKLFYLCGVSNIDMVDNYVSLPRSASRRA